jgi:hypothetical protein
MWSECFTEVQPPGSATFVVAIHRHEQSWGIQVTTRGLVFVLFLWLGLLGGEIRDATVLGFSMSGSRCERFEKDGQDIVRYSSRCKMNELGP